jgi:SAM-dependent methyltransferase
VTTRICHSCQLRFIAERPTDSDQAAIYEDASAYRRFAEAERSANAVLLRRHEWASLLGAALNTKAFFERERRRPRLLDIGCGTGDFLAIAREVGFDVDGLELSSVAAALAREYHDLDIRVGDLKSDRRDGHFEAITLLGVLEHVLDPADLLLHASRLLAPGGVLLIYTPVWGRYDRLASFIARTSAGRWSRLIDRRISTAHLQIFPQGTLKNLLESGGLKVEQSQRVCEYNLPVKYYLRSLGLTSSHLERIAASIVAALIASNLFFRNNQRVLAVKAAT